ncbi:MAG: hypothetical protein KDC95_10880 [Planctomycetes bacterium]|nr:hypothetical protein [Planctomycetota bacterium]
MTARIARVVSIWIVAIVLIAWGAFASTPSSRVAGFADWIGAQNARIATNMVRLGTEGRGAQLLNLEAPRSTRDWILYHGHPPTLDWMTSGLFRVTGSSHIAVQRLVPILAALVAIVLLAILARRIKIDPLLAIGVFASFPFIGAHGIDFSYEPLCLAALLGLVVLYDRGWRFRLLPLFFVFGWFDYPVLYLGPYLALVELVRRRDRAAVLFTILLGIVCVASLVSTLAHAAWSGAIAGNRGQGIVEKILSSFAPKPGFEPTAGAYLDAAWRQFSGGLSWPGFALGVVGLGCVLFGSRLFDRGHSHGPASTELRVAALAFVFVGALHCLAFRAHFVLHDFWAVYWTPAFALSIAACLARLPASVRIVLLVVLGVFGLRGTFAIWNERASEPVRAVARDLDHIDPERTTVFHQLRAPAGWAIENERWAPVYEGTDLVLHLARIASDDPNESAAGLLAYKGFLDNLGGTRGDLERTQEAFLYLPKAHEGDRDIVRRLLSSRDGRTVTPGSGASYVLWSLDRQFFDPRGFPAFSKVSEDDVRVLGLRAMLFAGLDALATALEARGAALDVIWLDGAAEGTSAGSPNVVATARGETFRGVRIVSAGRDALEAREKDPRSFGSAAFVVAGRAPLAGMLRDRFEGSVFVVELPRVLAFRDEGVSRFYVLPAP